VRRVPAGVAVDVGELTNVAVADRVGDARWAARPRLRLSAARQSAGLRGWGLGAVVAVAMYGNADRARADLVRLGRLTLLGWCRAYADALRFSTVPQPEPTLMFVRGDRRMRVRAATT
jgi:hypothetical protein